MDGCRGPHIAAGGSAPDEHGGWWALPGMSTPATTHYGFLPAESEAAPEGVAGIVTSVRLSSWPPSVVSPAPPTQLEGWPAFAPHLGAWEDPQTVQAGFTHGVGQHWRLVMLMIDGGADESAEDGGVISMLMVVLMMVTLLMLMLMLMVRMMMLMAVAGGL